MSHSSPSFKINGAIGASQLPRWDRIDSRTLIGQARKIYFQYLTHTPGGHDPIGVILDSVQNEGRVIFDTPVLLPDEEFIAFDLIRGRGTRTRNRCKG
ncbi:MAG: hypothetical protein CMN93_00835 [Synechococcus sp. CPC35]|nr:hypothetical protein [Synechococcus sp. CPC35]